MSVFRQTIEVGDLTGTRFQSMDAIVDTGATFTVVPASILNNLGVVPNRRVRFRLADGGLLDRDVGETMVRVLDYQAHQAGSVWVRRCTRPVGIRYAGGLAVDC
jgi:predicted aspartyl protease